jgi:hypothetical protein
MFSMWFLPNEFYENRKNEYFYIWMGGCLGPTRDVHPIYIDLIDQIYSEAERL